MVVTAWEQDTVIGRVQHRLSLTHEVPLVILRCTWTRKSMSGGIIWLQELSQEINKAWALQAIHSAGTYLADTSMCLFCCLLPVTVIYYSISQLPLHWKRPCDIVTQRGSFCFSSERSNYCHCDLLLPFFLWRCEVWRYSSCFGQSSCSHKKRSRDSLRC